MHDDVYTNHYTVCCIGRWVAGRVRVRVELSKWGLPHFHWQLPRYPTQQKGGHNIQEASEDSTNIVRNPSISQDTPAKRKTSSQTRRQKEHACDIRTTGDSCSILSRRPIHHQSYLSDSKLRSKADVSKHPSKHQSTSVSTRVPTYLAAYVGSSLTNLIP